MDHCHIKKPIERDLRTLNDCVHTFIHAVSSTLEAAVGRSLSFMVSMLLFQNFSTFSYWTALYTTRGHLFVQ